MRSMPKKPKMTQQQAFHALFTVSEIAELMHDTKVNLALAIIASVSAIALLITQVWP